MCWYRLSGAAAVCVGFVEEVAHLLEMGYDARLPALQGFGYRELVAYHQGKCSLQEALEGDIRATRAFFSASNDVVSKIFPNFMVSCSRLENSGVFAELIGRCRTFLLEGEIP